MEGHSHLERFLKAVVDNEQERGRVLRVLRDEEGIVNAAQLMALSDAQLAELKLPPPRLRRAFADEDLDAFLYRILARGTDSAHTKAIEIVQTLKADGWTKSGLGSKGDGFFINLGFRAPDLERLRRELGQASNSNKSSSGNSGSRTLETVRPSPPPAFVPETKHSSMTVVKTSGRAKVFARNVSATVIDQQNTDVTVVDASDDSIVCVSASITARETGLKKEGDAALPIWEQHNECVCQEEEFIFLPVPFVKKLDEACAATVTFHRKGAIFGTGFLIKEKEAYFVMTAMHNIAYSYQDECSKTWKQFNWEHSTFDHYKLNFVSSASCVVGFESGTIEKSMTRLEFSADSIDLFPNLDVAILKVMRVIGKAMLPAPLKLWRDGRLDVGAGRLTARCFAIGHPEEAANKPISQKVVSMQRSNFVFETDGLFVKYFADTLRGFSGGPVLMWSINELLVVAVHQCGVELKHMSSDKAEKIKALRLTAYNEGALVSHVLKQWGNGL